MCNPGYTNFQTLDPLVRLILATLIRRFPSSTLFEKFIDARNYFRNWRLLSLSMTV